MGADSTDGRILVVKLADLGDVLLCEPALRSLRTAFPSTRIDVLTTPGATTLLDLFDLDLRPIPFPKQLFDNPRSLADPRNQWRAASLAVTLRRGNYSQVVILHHLTTAFGTRKFDWLARATGCSDVAGLDNGRGTFLSRRVSDHGFGARHEATYMRDVAVAAGGSLVDDAPMVANAASVDLPPTFPDAFVAIFPATGPFSRAREWSAERFGHIARRLQLRELTPVIVGGDDARPAAAAISAIEPSTIDMSGRTTLPELIAILHRARFVVGGDSFIGHLAAAVGTPVIAIFGPTNADAWRPYGSVDADTASPRLNPSLIVRHRLPCVPCIYTGFRLGRPNGCPDRTCLTRVNIDNVDRAITRVLGAI